MNITLPRYQELSAIGLYKDQVVELLNGYISPFYGTEKPVTDTMVNNYVKLKVIAPPVKKRYSRPQLAQLVMTCLLKKVLSMAEIRALFSRWDSETALETAYDRFCQTLEDTLAPMLSAEEPGAEGTAFALQGSAMDPLVDSAIGAFACKTCFEQLLGS